MADLILQMAISLDGYIEDEHGSLDFARGDYLTEALHTETLRSIDGMVFGRKAHALLATFWPHAGHVEGASDALIEQAELMNTLPKYVLTHGEDGTGWSNSRAAQTDEVLRVKRSSKRPIALYAGAVAARSLMDHIDELRLLQYPVFLGAGTRLFDRGSRRDFQLVESRTFSTGMVLLRYRAR
jgi:dihydrofolate reductase